MKLLRLTSFLRLTSLMMLTSVALQAAGPLPQPQRAQPQNDAAEAEQTAEEEAAFCEAQAAEPPLVRIIPSITLYSLGEKELKPLPKKDREALTAMKAAGIFESWDSKETGKILEVTDGTRFTKTNIGVDSPPEFLLNGKQFLLMLEHDPYRQAARMDTQKDIRAQVAAATQPSPLKKAAGKVAQTAKRVLPYVIGAAIATAGFMDVVVRDDQARAVRQDTAARENAENELREKRENTTETKARKAAEEERVNREQIANAFNNEAERLIATVKANPSVKGIQELSAFNKAHLKQLTPLQAVSLAQAADSIEIEILKTYTFKYRDEILKTYYFANEYRMNSRDRSLFGDIAENPKLKKRFYLGASIPPDGSR